MRNLVLMFIVAFLGVAGLARPMWGIMGYTWFAIMRPDVMAYARGAPYSVILAATTLVGAAREIPTSFRLLLNPVVMIFGVLQVLFAISVVEAVHPAYCFPEYQIFLQASLMAVLIPLLIRTLPDVRNMLIVCATSMAMVGAKIGLFGFMVGGMWLKRGFAGSLGDNNMVALAMAMGIPLVWHSRALLPYTFWKVTCAGLVLLELSTLFMTHSRGGIITLVVVIPLLILRSKRKLVLAVALVALMLPGFFLVRETLVDRVATIGSFESDESAMGRVTMWKAAFALSKDYPMLGVGFGGGNWLQEGARYVADQELSTMIYVHNNYLQMVVDAGYPALFVFLMLLFGSIIWLESLIRKHKKENDDIYNCASALQIALIAFSVGSIFLSRVSWDFIYILLMVVASLWNAVAATKASQSQVAASATLAGGPSLPPTPKPDVPSEVPSEVPNEVANDVPNDVPDWAAPGAGRRLRMRQFGANERDDR